MRPMRVFAYAAIALSVSGCGVLEERDATTARTSSASVPAAPTQTAAGPAVSDGSPMDAQLSIPQIGVDGLEVIAYTGKTDDGPGTEIQNNGLAASPSGPEGGVGPGGVGNYQVTAHRLSSTQAFLRLPELRSGDRVDVVAGDRRYVYKIVQTRETSFRSEASLRAQRSGVPGNPGAKPVAAYITLSTCATPEDHAAGNYWSDEFGNPEHRIDKIGRLVESEPVQARR